MRFDVFRTNCRGIGGLVDYLGQLEAASEDEAEDIARLMFDFDHGRGERCELEVTDTDAGPQCAF